MITWFGAHDTGYLLFWLEIHHNGWELLEAENKIFFDLLDIIVACTEHNIFKIIFDCVTEDDISFESSVLFGIEWGGFDII